MRKGSGRRVDVMMVVIVLVAVEVVNVAAVKLKNCPKYII
jgi:hypothetical protein